MKHLEIFGGFVFLLNFAGRKQKNSILLKKKKKKERVAQFHVYMI